MSTPYSESTFRRDGSFLSWLREKVQVSAESSHHRWCQPSFVRMSRNPSKPLSVAVIVATQAVLPRTTAPQRGEGEGGLAFLCLLLSAACCPVVATLEGRALLPNASSTGAACKEIKILRILNIVNYYCHKTVAFGHERFQIHFIPFDLDIYSI